MTETNFVKLAQDVGQAALAYNKAKGEFIKRISLARDAGLTIAFELGTEPGVTMAAFAAHLPPVIALGKDGLLDWSQAVGESLGAVLVPAPADPAP